MGIHNSTHLAIVFLTKKVHSQLDKIRIQFIDTYKIDNINFINEIINLVSVCNSCRLMVSISSVSLLTSTKTRSAIAMTHSALSLPSSWWPR